MQPKNKSISFSGKPFKPLSEFCYFKDFLSEMAINELNTFPDSIKWLHSYPYDTIQFINVFPNNEAFLDEPYFVVMDAILTYN